MIVRVLVVSPEARLRNRLERVLLPLPEIRINSDSPSGLWDNLNRGDVDLLLLDGICLSGDPEQLVASIRKLPEQPEVVALTGGENPTERARLLGSGCLAVLNVGLEDSILCQTVGALLGRRRKDQAVNLRDRLRLRSSLRDFESVSPNMKRFMDTARRVVGSDSSLLLLGETGVGKERLASAIHHEGPRRQGPFLCVNCAALPETLLESELFGHEQGAYTGAIRTRRGYFEMAHGGTIFLDEIAEMPPHLQVKLLRVLENRTVQRLGGEKTLRVDVRLMAATNRDLDAEVAAGRFRSDLFFRLAVVMLTLPPLRERREDIPGLLDSYLEHFGAVMGGRQRSFTPAAREALLAYDWPGNVRELINIVERCLLLTPGPDIDVPDLPSGVVRPAGTSFLDAATADGGPQGPGAAIWTGVPLVMARKQVLDEFHRQYLHSLMTEHQGRMGEAARAAGVSVRCLYDLMRRCGLRKEEYKPGLKGREAGGG